MDSDYRHTQMGILVLVSIGAAVVLATCIGLIAGFPPFLLAVAAFLVLMMLLFGTLTVIVDREQVLVRFGPGLIRKRFPLAEIRDVRCVRNKWYYGWGIRWTPHGWLYNVSGLDAVEIGLAGGKRARIGTDEPRELQAAIERARGGESGKEAPA